MSTAEPDATGNGAHRLLFTKREAARQLGLSDRYLHALIQQKGLPLVRFGRAVRVPADVVAELARSGA